MNETIETLVTTAAVRDLITLTQYGKTQRVVRAARKELQRRRLCGACGSPAHTFCGGQS